MINVYYAANDQTYSVYYYLEGTETPVPGTTAKENVSAKFDETVTETAPAVTGYTVAGDSPTQHCGARRRRSLYPGISRSARLTALPAR